MYPIRAINFTSLDVCQVCYPSTSTSCCSVVGFDVGWRKQQGSQAMSLCWSIDSFASLAQSLLKTSRTTTQLIENIVGYDSNFSSLVAVMWQTVSKLWGDLLFEFSHFFPTGPHFLWKHASVICTGAFENTYKCIHICDYIYTVMGILLSWNRDRRSVTLIHSIVLT